MPVVESLGNLVDVFDQGYEAIKVLISLGLMIAAPFLKEDDVEAQVYLNAKNFKGPRIKSEKAELITFEALNSESAS